MKFPTELHKELKAYSLGFFLRIQTANLVDQCIGKEQGLDHPRRSFFGNIPHPQSVRHF